jgi:predicted AlkP superfamily pyrophosphatase or phosphodiesterase
MFSFMRSLICVLFVLITTLSGITQTTSVQRPKLIVGIVVDQMRWDYLYRYYDRYDTNGGFKRMLNQGFTCENTLIPYTPTITACGHSSIYSGSVPAISGITGNFWWDKNQMKSVYCTEDMSVNTVGSGSTLGQMSPKNMLVTTICDELRLATNFRSKVIGIAIKDRGGILTAGHSANAAYWYDYTVGGWITSTYYMNELPKWVNDFNKQKLVDKYFQQGWNLLYPANTYVQSTGDEKKYESTSLGTQFPHDLKKFIGKDYGILPSTPFGNTFTAEFAKAAVIAEQLGADAITDFLAVSFSTPDYIGHSFGPNSIEAEDGFLRLDKDLGSLFNFLDEKVGKNQYTVFLSADHGVAHVPEFMEENNLPAGRVFLGTVTDNLNKTIKKKFNIDTAIVSDENYQLHLNHPRIEAAKINKPELIQWIVDRISLDSGIARVFALNDLNITPLPFRIREMINNGYYPPRNGDIQVILLPQYIGAYSTTGTTHGSWNPYDAHIPLLWYGWGIKQGKTNRETYMTDIAPTLAALLHIQMPNGCVGDVIEEIIK